MNEISELCPTRKHEVISQLEGLLRKYIFGEAKFEDVEREYRTIMTTDVPLIKLQKILQMDSRPLPPAMETFISNSALNPHHLIARKKARAWTEQEDMRLLAGIHRFGLDAWGQVTSFVGSGRSRSQCSQRWFRGLDPRISKVLWTQEEDDRLLQLVAEHGDHCWTKISNELGNRSDAQCRYRYSHILKGEAAKQQQKETEGSSGLKEVASVPKLMLKPDKMLSTTQSMMVIPKKVKLPPITELIANIGTL